MTASARYIGAFVMGGVYVSSGNEMTGKCDYESYDDNSDQCLYLQYEIPLPPLGILAIQSFKN